MTMHIRTRGASAVLASALLVAACGTSDGGSADVEATGPQGFAATPQYLSALAEQSTAESFRFSQTIALPGVAPTTVGEGAIDGDVVSLMSGPGQPELNIFSDGSDNVYLQVPFLLDIPDSRLDATHSELKTLLEPTDGWLMVTQAQMTGYTAQETEEIVGSGPTQRDPVATVEVVANGQDAEELEPQEIQGEEMVGISAVVRFVDLLEADGTDPDGFVELMSSAFEGMLQGGSVPPEVADSFVETMFDVMVETDVNIDVWVDEAGYLRQMSYAFDMAAILDDTVNHFDDLDLPEVPPSMTTQTTMDFYDYGEDLGLEAPEDAADLTQRPDLFDYWSLMQLMAPQSPQGSAPMAPS
jgi:predicted small secreted protein